MDLSHSFTKKEITYSHKASSNVFITLIRILMEPLNEYKIEEKDINDFIDLVIDLKIFVLYDKAIPICKEFAPDKEKIIEDLQNNFSKTLMFNQQIANLKGNPDLLIEAILKAYPYVGNESLKYIFDLPSFDKKYIEQFSKIGNPFLDSLNKYILEQKNDPKEDTQKNIIECIKGKEMSQVKLSQITDEDLSFEDPEGNTVLHIAASNNNADFVQRGLSFIDVNKQNKKGQTPLHLALINGNIEIARLLLNSSADIEVKDSKGRTPFNEETNRNVSVKNLYAEISEVEPEEKYVYKLQKDNYAFNQVKEGRTSAFINLITNHNIYSINDYNEEGKTYLDCAAIIGRSDIVDFLLSKKNIMLNEKDKCEKWPLYYAIENLKFDIAKKIMSNPKADLDLTDKSGYTILHLAAIKHAVELIPSIVDSVSDPNAKDKFGKTPLFLAAQKGASDSVKALLNSPKVNISEKDNNGDNIMHIAAMTARIDVIRAIADHRELLNDQDIQGKTPLFLAVEKGDANCVKTLLGFGADPNISDKENRTALMYVMTKSNPDVVDALLSSPMIDVNKTGKLGRTVLHMMAMSGREESLKKLVQYHSKTGKVDVNAKDEEGRTAFFLAVINRQNKNAQSLATMKGINVQLVDNDGHSPFEYTKDRNILSLASRPKNR